MELIRGLANLKPRHRGCAASIGNYDGVHLGHQQVLRELVTQARRRGVPAAVVVFEPAPLEYLEPDKAPARLMNLREKVQALAACGVDRLLCLRFNAALAQMVAAEFIERVLVRGLGVRHLVVGDDFRFGRDRGGDLATLQAAGAERGFEVQSLPGLLRTGARVSSTRIRACLAAGNLQLAAELLGGPYSLSGRVMHGEKLGKALGFPTANIALKRRVAPVNGIFVAAVRALDGATRYGAAYVGKRPAAGGRETRLEVFIFDFKGELYGRHLRVELLHQLRDDAQFGSLEALKAQMAQDVAAARAWLKQRALV
ncbi:MAG: bifunctional riboflavin kinase/FAD synthetase [Gammaproteobacteria bacterium]